MSGELMVVFSTDDEIEANIVKGILESSGIMVMDEPGMTIYGQPTFTLYRRNIHVLESQADEAMSLIEQVRKG